MKISRKVWFQHISYRDAPEAQRHVSDRRIGRRATSGRGRTVGYASEIGLKLIPSTSKETKRRLFFCYI